jgi:hypothetical protein
MLSPGAIQPFGGYLEDLQNPCSSRAAEAIYGGFHKWYPNSLMVFMENPEKMVI